MAEKEMAIPLDWQRKINMLGMLAQDLGGFNMLDKFDSLTATYADGKIVVFAEWRSPEALDYPTYDINLVKVQAFRAWPAEQKYFIIRFGDTGDPMYVRYPQDFMECEIKTRKRIKARSHGGKVRRDTEPVLCIPASRFRSIKSLKEEVRRWTHLR